MIEIRVLGSGCAKCRTTQRLIEEVTASKGLEVCIEKVEDMASIARIGVMSTPAVVVDGRVVHSGGVPGRAQVEQWFER